jgi:hypothetical protein
VWKSKFYGAFVLNRRVVLHAIDATPALWRGDAGFSQLDRARTVASSPGNDLVKNFPVHPTHWLISTQPRTIHSSRAALLVGRPRRWRPEEWRRRSRRLHESQQSAAPSLLRGVFVGVLRDD